MQVDRSGWRVLAFAATVVGFGGLAIMASGILPWLGIVVTAASLLALLGTAWTALQERSQVADAAPTPTVNPDFAYAEPDMFPERENEWIEDEPAQPIAPVAPVAPLRSPRAPLPQPAEIDLESPLQRALAGLPPKPSAPSRYTARMPVIPEDEAEADEPVQRARRLVPSGQTLGEKREAAKKAKAKQAAPDEMEFTVVPAKPRAAARPAVVAQPKVPLMVARKAGRGPVPPELARGKCSGCDTILWAPKARPINLRCPECDKITLLQ